MDLDPVAIKNKKTKPKKKPTKPNQTLCQYTGSATDASLKSVATAEGMVNGLEQQARNASIPREQQAQLHSLLSLSPF